MKKWISVIFIFVLLLQGCSSNKTDKDATDATETDANALITTKVTVTPLPPQLVLPVIVNDSGKVTIQTVSSSLSYRTNSYIITSSNGEKIVVDPTEMPKKSIVDIDPTAIMSTHTHPDHTDARFVKEYPEAQTLLYTEGEISTSDFHIYSIPAAHNGDTINKSNYLMVFEVDGLRIAHMGDIGQTKLTDDQLEALGEIDIAFMQFENSYSDMNVKNMKGFNLIEQLNPTIIIPTHYASESQDKLEEKYGTINKIENLLEITKEDLPDTKLNVYEISNTHTYK